MKRNISVFISVVSLVLSIVALCNAYPRSLGIDYLGWIVGILALVTAILLGWQIYILFDLKNIKEDIKNRDESIYFRSENNFAEMHLGLLLHYTDKLIKTDNDYFYLVHHGISAILHLSRICEYPKCADIIDLILHYEEEIKNLKTTQSQKESISELLLSVENVKQIPRFPKLLAVLLQ